MKAHLVFFLLVSFFSSFIIAEDVIKAKPRGMLSDPCADLAVLNTIADGYTRWNTLQAHLRENDWPYLCRYRQENSNLDPHHQPEIVFMGDSITEMWVGAMPHLFGDNWIGRGIGGQTSSQMVARFYQDVVSLHPRRVHLMVGTNDLAGNSGANSFDQYKNNIRAMADLAHANGIEMMIASVLPADRFSWRPELAPADEIIKINQWLQEFAVSKGLTYIDYYSPMVNEKGGLPVSLAEDGVHPTLVGYQQMHDIFRQVIAN